MRQRIPFLDVAFPRTADTKIAGEEHPNGKMNGRWAENMARAFQIWKWLPASTQADVPTEFVR